MQEYVEQCIDVNNVLNLLQAAEMFHIEHLREHCLGFVCSHFKEVREREEFQSLDKELLIEVMRSLHV